MRQHDRLGVSVIRGGVDHGANVGQIFSAVVFPGRITDFNFPAEIERLRCLIDPDTCRGRRVQQHFIKLEFPDFRIHDNADASGLDNAKVGKNGFYVVRGEEVNKGRIGNQVVF